MEKKKKLEIEISLSENSQIYNEFNDNQLSDELSNYIYNQCKGKPVRKNIVLNINHKFKMNEEDKIKLINSIRENYGIDIKENLLKLGFEHVKEFILIVLGSLLLLISNFFNYIDSPIISEIISIFGCVIIWETAHNIFFLETEIRLAIKRLKKLTNAKINFNEII